MVEPLYPPHPTQIANTVHSALLEDLYPYTERSRLTRSPLPVEMHRRDPSLQWVDPQTISMYLYARSDGVLCGGDWFDRTYLTVDPDTRLNWRLRDGECFQAGELIAGINGDSRALLLAERTALNFLQTLSGIATTTAEFVQAMGKARSHTKLLDTRKTIPLLREAEKFAVRCGGGHNHRMGLYDALMLKDNHLAQILSGQQTPAIDLSRWQTWRADHPDIEVIIEVEDFSQLERVVILRPHRILADNIAPARLSKIIDYCHRHPIEVEASGDITIDNIAEYARTGVDYISVGALTKNLEAIEFSLRSVRVD